MIRAMAVVLPLIFTAPVDYTGTSTRAVASYEAFFHDASDGAIVIKLAYNGPRGDTALLLQDGHAACPDGWPSCNDAPLRRNEAVKYEQAEIPFEDE